MLNDHIARRAAAFEKMAPYQRAAACTATARPISPPVTTSSPRPAGALPAILPEDVALQPVGCRSLDSMLSFETWSRLRREQNLTARRARAVAEEIVQKPSAEARLLPRHLRFADGLAVQRLHIHGHLTFRAGR